MELVSFDLAVAGRIRGDPRGPNGPQDHSVPQCHRSREKPDQRDGFGFGRQRWSLGQPVDQKTGNTPLNTDANTLAFEEDHRRRATDHIAWQARVGVFARLRLRVSIFKGARSAEEGGWRHVRRTERESVLILAKLVRPGGGKPCLPPGRTRPTTYGEMWDTLRSMEKKEALLSFRAAFARVMLATNAGFFSTAWRPKTSLGPSRGDSKLGVGGLVLWGKGNYQALRCPAPRPPSQRIGRGRRTSPTSFATGSCINNREQGRDQESHGVRKKDPVTPGTPETVNA